MKYEDLVIQLGPTTERGTRVQVSSSCGGDTRGWFKPAFSLDRLASSFRPAVNHGMSEAQCHSLRHFVAPPEDETRSMNTAEIGHILFTSLFAGGVASVLDRSLGSIDGDPNLGLRIKLKLNLADQDEAVLYGLPWELLYRAETADYLGLRRRCPIVRYVEVPQPAHAPPLLKTLRVLAVTGSQPENLPLDLASELRNLQLLAQQTESFEVEHLPASDLSEVRNALLDGQFSVLHFMGHGDVDPGTGRNVLLFENANGGTKAISSIELVTALQDQPTLRLVVLNACNPSTTQREGAINPYSGLGPALMRGGLPAVVTMQLPIPDWSAIEFSKVLYRRLCFGDPVDAAVSEGRQAIYSKDSSSAAWAIPALFMRVPNGVLFRTDRHARDRAPEGLQHLQIGNYDQAVSVLRQELVREPNCGLLKIALGIAIGRGNRLKRLAYRSAKEMHRLFAEALSDEDSRSLGAAALIALKLDYFQKNSVRDAPPSLEQCLAILTQYPLGEDEKQLLNLVQVSKRSRAILAQP